MPHTAQIPFAFFANIADKHERQRVPDAHRPQQGCNPQHGGNTGAIVRNTGSVNPASLLADIQRGIRRKNRVDVRAERNETPAKSGMSSKYVADIIDANVIEPDFAETL